VRFLSQVSSEQEWIQLIFTLAQSEQLRPMFLLMKYDATMKNRYAITSSSFD
jgi:hypothetical protein